MTAAFVERGEGHQLFVRDWGSGPPVVLMAGWGMDSRVWGETMLMLNAAGLRTVAYDRRGHGRSTDWGGYGYDELADDLAAVLDGLDLHRVSLVTHSGGAGEAIRHLSRAGNGRVERLFLVGAAGPKMIGLPDGAGITAEMLDLQCSRLAEDLPGWIDENVEPFAPGASRRTTDWLSTMVMDCSRRAIVEFQRTIGEADLEGEAAALDVPTCIIHGDRDVSAPIDMTGRRFASTIPGAEMVVYDGVAHGVMVTHPARLAADVAGRIPR